jgi:MFS family permease
MTSSTLCREEHQHLTTHAATGPGDHPALETDSAYAWLRLTVATVMSTIGSIGMWSVVVALPVVQAEFQIERADASLPFTMAMTGFAAGGIVLGRLADRWGIVLPLVLSAAALAIGYVGASYAPNLWVFAAAHLIIGIGCAATFGPLIADTSHWFLRRRGIAVAICATGNYLAGTIWPPIVQHFIATDGWRMTHFGIGLFCAATLVPLALTLRRRWAGRDGEHADRAGLPSPTTLGMSPNALTVLLSIAGVACCVAMSMPQVHIVALCADRGYGVARGAEMLSLMLAFGIVNRIITGFVADRFGGLKTLLLGSALQAVALLLYLGADGLTSLYVVSALFGLFQGGIVPSYAIIVREYFSPKEAGTRLGIILMATMFGMALGGWMSGKIFDLTGSYHAAFLNGIAWNLLNIAIALWLLTRPGRRLAPA